MSVRRLARDVVPPAAAWPFASGVLLALACPPFHLLIPSFVALVPLLVWLDERPPGPGTRREARRGGFLCGLVAYTLIFHWLAAALAVFGLFASIGFVIPLLLMAALLGLVADAVRLVRDRLRWPLWLGIAVFWTAGEWLRASLPELGFPWMQLGDTLTGYPWLVGAADLVGSRGVSLWLALVNGVLAGGVVAWRRYGIRRALTAGRGAGLLLLLALPIGYSLVRWTTLRVRPAATVAIVQPNVPEAVKRDPPAAIDSAQRATRTLLAELRLEPAEIDLLVLPETVFPERIEAVPSAGLPGRPDLEGWIGELALQTRARVLYGAIGAEDRGGGRYEVFNSAFLADAGGARLARYDKRHLVPLVERVPFLNPRWFSGLPSLGGFGRGEAAVPLRAGEARFGVSICFESIFAGHARRQRRNGAEFLVNITNDAWFGRASWWGGSGALWQHPAHLVMRAIETRVGIARGANTGVSSLVDPLGRVQHQTGLFTPAAFAGRVWTTDGHTVYERVGDLAGWGAVAAALIGLIAVRRGGRGSA